MKNKEDIQHEIDKTLQCLDGIKRAEANPFLYTRILARMQKDNGWEKVISFISRPAVVFATLVILMAINGVTFFNTTDENSTTRNESFATADFDDEYNLVSTINYDYENNSGE